MTLRAAILAHLPGSSTDLATRIPANRERVELVLSTMRGLVRDAKGIFSLPIPERDREAAQSVRRGGRPVRVRGWCCDKCGEADVAKRYQKRRICLRCLSVERRRLAGIRSNVTRRARDIAALEACDG